MKKTKIAISFLSISEISTHAASPPRAAWHSRELDRRRLNHLGVIRQRDLIILCNNRPVFHKFGRKSHNLNLHWHRIMIIFSSYPSSPPRTLCAQVPLLRDNISHSDWGFRAVWSSLFASLCIHITDNTPIFASCLDSHRISLFPLIRLDINSPFK